MLTWVNLWGATFIPSRGWFRSGAEMRGSRGIVATPSIGISSAENARSLTSRYRTTRSADAAYARFAPIEPRALNGLASAGAGLAARSCRGYARLAGQASKGHTLRHQGAGHRKPAAAWCEPCRHCCAVAAWDPPYSAPLHRRGRPAGRYFRLPAYPAAYSLPRWPRRVTMPNQAQVRRPTTRPPWLPLSWYVRRSSRYPISLARTLP